MSTIPLKAWTGGAFKLPIYFIQKVVIRPDLEIPKGRLRIRGKLATLRRAILAIKDTGPFEWEDNHNPYRAAEQLGVKITTRKLNGNGYVVGLFT